MVSYYRSSPVVTGVSGMQCCILVVILIFRNNGYHDVSAEGLIFGASPVNLYS